MQSKFIDRRGKNLHVGDFVLDHTYSPAQVDKILDLQEADDSILLRSLLDDVLVKANSIYFIYQLELITEKEATFHLLKS